MRKFFTEDVILAGLTCHWLDPSEAQPVWNLLPGVTDVGAIGEQAEKKEKTVLADDVKRYGAGMQDAPDKAIKGYEIPYQSETSQYYDEYQLQQKFFKQCRNLKEVWFRGTWKDGSQQAFLFAPLGFETDSPNEQEWKAFTVNGSQNTKVLWAVDISGDKTVTTTTQLKADTDPVDLKRIDGEKFNWSSSDETIATVDQDGKVAKVKAGKVTIMAELRGVTGYHDMTAS